MAKALQTLLEGMYYRLPMMTFELRGTDRVTSFGLSYGPIVAAMTGSSVPITQPPTFHVTWSNIDANFAALERVEQGLPPQLSAHVRSSSPARSSRAVRA